MNNPIVLMGGILGGLGTGELMVILLICLILFGPKAIPQLGRALGKGIREFKDATDKFQDTLEDEVAESERRNKGQLARQATAPAVPAVTTPEGTVAANTPPAATPAPQVPPPAAPPANPLT